MSSKAANKGFTILEILIASVVVTIVAGGTLSAFITAARIISSQGQLASRVSMAIRVMERNRNHVAASLSQDMFGDDWLTLHSTGAQQGWRTDSSSTPDVTRKVCVVQGCNGVMDCYTVSVRVCWNNSTCPAEGAPCS